MYPVMVVAGYVLIVVIMKICLIVVIMGIYLIELGNFAEAIFREIK